MRSLARSVTRLLAARTFISCPSSTCSNTSWTWSRCRATQHTALATRTRMQCNAGGGLGGQRRMSLRALCAVPSWRRSMPGAVCGAVCFPHAAGRGRQARQGCAERASTRCVFGRLPAEKGLPPGNTCWHARVENGCASQVTLGRWRWQMALRLQPAGEQGPPAEPPARRRRVD